MMDRIAADDKTRDAAARFHCSRYFSITNHKLSVYLIVCDGCVTRLNANNVLHPRLIGFFNLQAINRNSPSRDQEPITSARYLDERITHTLQFDVCLI